MTAKYFDDPAGEDTVRLLSNPLNCEHLHSDEHSEDYKSSNGSLNYCQVCTSNNEGSNVSVGLIDNEHPLSNDYNGDCHHCHQFIPKDSSNNSKSKIILAMSLCMAFMIAEVIGGYIAGSLAVTIDGAHLLTDLVGFFISLIAISSSKKKSSRKFNLGFFRIEVMATLISVSLIWIMTAVFMYLATIRLIKNDYEIDVDMMILLSCIGVVINIVMFSVLHGKCHPHHTHSHHLPVLGDSCRNQNINVRAAMIHVIGDLVQSVGVFISSIIIKIKPSAKFMDPVCTFLFSVIVIFSTLKLLKDSVYIVMEAFPSNIEYNSVLMSLQSVNGVRHVHSLCVWSLTMDTNVLTVHLAVDDIVERDAILLQAQKLLANQFGIYYCTIQIEKYHSKCMHSCRHCQPLWK